MNMEMIPIEISTENSLDSTREFGLFLIKCLSTIKMIHWYTDTYNAHVIFGSLYEDIEELFDELQEEIIGTTKQSNILFPRFSFNCEQYENISLYRDENLKILDVYYNLYNDITNVLTSLEFNTHTTKIKSGIKNTVDSIITRFNKTNYLLSSL